MSEALATVEAVPRIDRREPVVHIVGDLLGRNIVFHDDRDPAREGEWYVHRARCGVVLDRRLWGTVITTRRSQRVLRAHAEKIARPCSRCFS